MSASMQHCRVLHQWQVRRSRALRVWRHGAAQRPGDSPIAAAMPIIFARLILRFLLQRVTAVAQSTIAFTCRISSGDSSEEDGLGFRGKAARQAQRRRRRLFHARMRLSPIQRGRAIATARDGSVNPD